jgi:DtxR family Mn-dependent transcriptional regulator
VPLSSFTVENYLKAIFQAQLRLPRKGDWCRWDSSPAPRRRAGHRHDDGQDAGRVGLVKYEPYAGVRLTALGENAGRAGRAAAPADRTVSGEGDGHELDRRCTKRRSTSNMRCRIGSSSRIDEMLAARRSDPHGDPIPDPAGVLERRRSRPLSCPVERSRYRQPRHRSGPGVPPVRERRGVKPGDVVEVEDRDPAADSVRLRGQSERAITIGTRAASKVLVQATG